MKPALSGLPPDFTRLWVGQTISEFGSRITRAGIPLIAVITLSATPAQMGILTAIASVPVLLLGLFAGVWVDRLRRRPIMIAADVARVALLLSIPAAALTGHLSMELLYGVLALMSMLGLLFEMAYRAYLPSLVERSQLVEANSRLSTTDSLAEIGGPAIAGMLIQVISAPFAIVLDALSFIFSASAFSLIRKPEPKPLAHADGRSMRREITEGVRLVMHDPLLRVLAISLGLRSLFGSFMGTLYDIFGIRYLGLTPAILGITIAAGGVGALAGALLASRIQRRFGLGKTLVWSVVVSTVVSLLIPLAGGSPALAAAMLILAQIIGDGAMTVYAINAISLVQIITPDRLLGRANASFGLIEQGIAPLGALVAGVLATVFDARLTLLLAVCGGLATALWFSRSAVRDVQGFASEETAAVV